jgi:hypothetical protein
MGIQRFRRATGNKRGKRESEDEPNGNTEGFGHGLREESKRDSSATQADSFAGANEKKKRRPASVGMTVSRFVPLKFVVLPHSTTLVHLVRILFIFAVRLLASKGARTFASLSK